MKKALQALLLFVMLVFVGASWAQSNPPNSTRPNTFSSFIIKPL